MLTLIVVLVLREREEKDNHSQNNIKTYTEYTCIMPQKSSEIGEKRRKGKDKMIERKKRNGKFSAKHVRQIENVKEIKIKLSPIIWNKYFI